MPDLTRAKRLFFSLFRRVQPFLLGLAFLSLAPLLLHRKFSRFGFNPTDEGFTLAMSRRLLDGRFPHRDFVSIRPVGSPLLHVPTIVFGGDHALLVDRYLCWLELAIVAWLSLTLFCEFLAVKLNAWERVAFASIALFLGANTFPMMAWHTVDGIALAILGAWIATRRVRFAKYLGLFVAGYSLLCKQSFLIVPPLAVVIFADHRDVRAWLAAFAPIGLYALLVWKYGAFHAFYVQATSQKDQFWPMAVKGFVGKDLIGWRTAIGFGLAYLAFSGKGSTPEQVERRRAFAAFCFCAIVLEATFALPPAADFWDAAFAVFATGLGVAGYLLFRGDDRAWRPAVFVIAVAWASSISLGLNAPTLMSGAIVALLLVSGRARQRATAIEGWKRTALNVGVATILAVFLWPRFKKARFDHLYRDKKSDELGVRLDGVFPGGAGLETNATTAQMLADLRVAVARTNGTPYTVLPDFAAYWIRAREKNPLPIDWAFVTEVNDPEILQPILDDLARRRGSLAIVMGKWRTESVATGRYPGFADYPVYNWVLAHYTKVDETEWFLIYR